jgi:Icc-related predicted phosphoesterase
MSRMSAAGIKVLDGTSYERAGVGFAGCKGFGGGFGRAALTSLGEPEIKSFVQAAVNESMKLESALSRLRSEKTAVVLHYLPIPDTARGEPLEIYPYLGSSRLGEVIDRRGVDLVIHSHAHFGTPEGRTLKGTPVYNVSLPLLRSSQPPRVYRVLEI